MKKLVLFFLFLIFGIGFVYGLDKYMSVCPEQEPCIYSSAKKIPKKKAALLLGTTKYLKGAIKIIFILTVLLQC